MGKGKRTKQSNIIDKQMLVEKKATEKAERRKSLKTEIIAVLCVVVFFVICIAGSVSYTVLTNNGFFTRKAVVAKTADFKVDAVMAQYFLNTAIDNFATESSSYATQLGFDADGDLKKQNYPYEDDNYETWYDYFEDNTRSQITELLSLCQAATDEGMKLDEADENYINKNLASIKNVADEANQTVEEYITENYGEGVTEKDLRRCLEITQLASKYYSKYNNSLTYTDSEINSYYTENRADFEECEYITYHFTPSQRDTAEKIAAEKSFTSFEKLLKKQLEAELKASDDPPADDELETETDEAFENCYSTMSYDVSTDAGEWLFSEKRKEGDATVIKSSTGYELYYVTSPAEKETYTTKNVRHILVSNSNDTDAAEKQADKLLKEWRNGEKTEESFAELATINSDDNGSVFVGGLYENVEKDQMVTEFNDWIYSSKRKAGDTSVIQTDYGYHVMYFVGDGTVAWQAPVISQMKSEDYSEKLTELKEKYDVKINDKKLAKAKQIFTEAEDTDSTAE